MERNEEELRQLARRRVQNRQGFIIHVHMFAAVNVALFAIWRATGAGYPWFLWPLFGWGIGLVGHALSMVFGPGSTSEQRAIERELDRLHGSRS